MATPIVPKTPLTGNPAAAPVPQPKAVEAALPSAPRDVEALNAAANLLLDQIPKYMAEHIREVATITCRIPIWAMVAGHLLKTYEIGDTQSPLLDPSWPRLFTDLGPDPSGRAYVCEWADCGKTFEPKRYKQRFCSQACGAQAQAAIMAKEAADYEEKRAAERATRRAQLAEIQR